MPTHERVRRNNRVQLHEGFATDLLRLRLPGKQRLFRVGVSNPLASEPIFQHPILGLQKLNDQPLTSVDPARHNGQEKRQ